MLSVVKPQNTRVELIIAKVEPQLTRVSSQNTGGHTIIHRDVLKITGVHSQTFRVEQQITGGRLH